MPLELDLVGVWNRLIPLFATATIAGCATHVDIARAQLVSAVHSSDIGADLGRGLISTFAADLFANDGGMTVVSFSTTRELSELVDRADPASFYALLESCDESGSVWVVGTIFVDANAPPNENNYLAIFLYEHLTRDAEAARPNLGENEVDAIESCFGIRGVMNQIQYIDSNQVPVGTVGELITASAA